MQELNLTPIKRQVTTAVNKANDLSIDSQESLVAATDILSSIKTAGKLIKGRKEEITKPLNDALKSARDLFRPLEDDLSTGERIIKSKMLDYENEIEEKRAAEAAKLEARVEKGTMRTDTAMRKMDDLETVDSTITGTKGKSSFRTVRVVKLVDVSKVPLKYLMNEKVQAALVTAARDDVLNGTRVEGFAIVNEKQVASR